MEYNAFLMSRNSYSAGNPVENNFNPNIDPREGAHNAVDAMVEESYLPSDITAYFALAQMTSLRKISFPECLVSFSSVLSSIYFYTSEFKSKFDKYFSHSSSHRKAATCSLKIWIWFAGSLAQKQAILFHQKQYK